MAAAEDRATPRRVTVGVMRSGSTALPPSSTAGPSTTGVSSASVGAPILDEVARMGFTTISIYIPWEVHERDRGKFDFEGNKDIDAFLGLIEEKGLDIVVGPVHRSTPSSPGSATRSASSPTPSCRRSTPRERPRS